MPSSSITLTVKGIPELLRKLQVETLVQPYVRAAMSEIGELGERSLRNRAPRWTGNLAAHLTHRMSATPIPSYVSWQSTATRSSRHSSSFPYPKRLEYDARMRHAGWMHDTIAGVFGNVGSLLNEAAQRIASEWGR